MTEDAILVVSLLLGIFCVLPLTCLLVARWRYKRKRQLAYLTTVGNGSMNTYMDIPKRDVHHLFHTLWTKAVGTDTYNKNEWKQMDAYLYSLLADPNAAQKIVEAERVVQPPSRFEREPVL